MQIAIDHYHWGLVGGCGIVQVRGWCSVLLQGWKRGKVGENETETITACTRRGQSGIND